MAHIRYKQLEKAKEQMDKHIFRKCFWAAIGGCMLNMNDTPGKITMEDFEKIKEFFARQTVWGEGDRNAEEKNTNT